MKKAKTEKTAKPIAGAAKIAQPLKVASPININPAQAIQGPAGKAQGYLGKFASKTSVSAPGKKRKKDAG